MADKVGILGVGSYVPDGILTNADLEKMVDTSDEWITTRTGIKERRICDEQTATSDLAYEASVRALEDAGVSPEELDLIIVATVSPDHMFPSTACFVQDRLGAKKAGAVDVGAACSGFIYALSSAWNFVRCNGDSKVLAVGAECLSKITDYTDRTSCIIFGDAAGAAIVGRTDGQNEILYTSLGADGSRAEIMIVPGGGTRIPATHETIEKRLHYMRIRGREVFKFAVRKMAELMVEGMEACGLSAEDVAYVIPHQVNLRVIEPAAERAGIPMEKVAVNIDKYGNTSSASIPVALDEWVKQGKIKSGDILILVGFGAGLTWGVTVMRW